MNTCRAGLVALGITLTTIVDAGATTPNLLGSWSGDSITENRSGCPYSGTFSIGIALTFLDQMDTSFAGNGTPSDGAGFDFGGSIVGNSLGGSFTGSEIVGSGTFSGTLSGDTIDLSYSGTDTDGCTFSGGGKVVRGAGVDSPNEAGTQTTSRQRTQNAARNYLNPLGTHLDSVMRGPSATGARSVQNGLLLQGGSGLAAGEDERLPVGVWGSYSRAHSKSSLSVAEYKADHNVFLGGVDFIPNDRIVAGVAIGYEYTDATTAFNGGRQKYSAFTVGPYVGALVNDWLSVDVTVAWSTTSFDQWRTNTATGARVTSDPGGTRGLIAGNFNATKALDDFILTGRAGMLWAQDAVNEFVESDGTVVARNASKLGQVRVGGEVAYAAGNFEPYFGGTFEYDYSTSGLSLSPGLGTSTFDDMGTFINFGVRYYTGNFSGALEYNKVLGRSNFDMDTFMIMLRGEF